jgi:phage-related protein
MIKLSSDNGATWKTPEDFGLVLQPGRDHSIAPATIDRTVRIAGMNGEYDFGADLGPRPLAYPMAFYAANSYREVQSSARKLLVFLTDGKGKPRTLWLVADEDPDKFYKVRYSGKMDIERQLAMGFFKLELTAFDPAKYLLEYAKDVGTYTGNNTIMLETIGAYAPGQLAYDFTITSNQTVTVTNFGTLDVSPTLTITGSFTTLNIAANGKTFIYGEAIESSTLTIEMDKFKAYVGGTNKNAKVSGDWLELLVGDNIVSFTGTGMNFTVSFSFRPKFM